MAVMAGPAAAVTRGLLWAEFAALYLGAPLAIALFMPPRMMFAALFGLTLAGLALLWRTGGFHWQGLLRGWRAVPPWQILAFGLAVALIGHAIIQIARPDYARPLTPERLRFLAVIWLLYPLLSALPQELIFRVLYFHRYARLFRGPRQAVLANAAIFSLAHLMYWNWIVLAFTFAGGLAFAIGYLRRGLPWAWALHAIAGNILFAVGMGIYFYSGNVVRPF